VNDTEERLRIYRLLSQNPEWVDTLEEALAIEGQGKEDWQWYEVHTPKLTLYKMVEAKILDISCSTRTATYFKIREPEMVKEAIKALKEPLAIPEEREIPKDLFKDIVGYDNIKTLIRYGIESEKPTHFLLSGVPASAKTLFLLDLGRLPNSFYCLAPTLTEAGLSDLLFTYQPQFLLIDEIDRLSGQNLGVLNSLMQTGIISETKFKKTRMIDLGTKVFAAGIRVERLPSDLLSRFVKLKFKPYTEKEFTDVTTSVLSREGINYVNAAYIAKAVWDMKQVLSDVRLCVSIARLAGNDTSKISEVVRTLRQYGL